MEDPIEQNDKKIDQQEIPVYKANRIKKVCNKEGKTYSGTMYRAGFRVNRQINLVGVGFFGPVEKDISDYKVKLEVTSTAKNYSGFRNFLKISGPRLHVEKLATYSVIIRGVPKQKTFHVRLPNSVKISPELWIDVRFELEGAKTAYLEEGHDESEVHIKDGTFVKFEFLRGSCQIPEILFSM